MTELIALFAEWRQDIDSEPFAHEAEWTSERMKETQS